MMDWRLDFVPMGTTVRLPGEPESAGARLLGPSEVCLDIGSRTLPRVVDHHDGTGRYRSAAEFATECFEELIGKPLAGVTEPVTFVLHDKPDLDACATLFYVVERLEDRPPNSDAWARVVELVSENDQGFTPAPPVEKAPALLFRGLARLFQKLIEEGSQGQDKFVREEALPFLQEWLRIEEAGGPSTALWDRLWTRASWRGVRRLVEEARLGYEDELRRARRIHVCLPRQHWNDAAPAAKTSTPDDRPEPTPLPNPSKWMLVDGAILTEPRSLLWKEMFRGERERSPMGRGFTVTLVHCDRGGAGQHIISVDPQGGVSLRGLGGRLEAEETRREQLEPERTRKGKNLTHCERHRCSPGRHGYGVDDPWYDGRGHAFTIIDNPGCGSVLTPGEVESVLWDYGNPARFMPLHGGTLGVALQVEFDASMSAWFTRDPEGWLPFDPGSAPLTDVVRGLLHASGDDRPCPSHLVRPVRPDPTLLGIEPDGMSGAARLHLVHMMGGNGALALEWDIEAGGQLTMHEAGSWINTLRGWFDRSLQSGLAPLFAALRMAPLEGLRIARNTRAIPLASLLFDDAHVDFRTEDRPTVETLLERVARGQGLDFHGLPGTDASRTPAVVSQERHVVFASEDGVGTFELASQASEQDRPRHRESFGSLLVTTALAHFQRRFLTKLEADAGDVMDRLGRIGGTRRLTDLHRVLVRFMSRWNLPEAATGWVQTTYSRLREDLRIRELGESASARVQQVAEQVQTASERFQNRLLFLLTVVFFPINMAAAIFSGLQMEQTSERLWFPKALSDWVSSGDPGPSGWAAFVIWLGFFVFTGFAIFLGAWWIGRRDRRDPSMLSCGSRRG